MYKILLLPALLSLATTMMAQVNYTANDQVLPYPGRFRYGANLNFYPGWTDLLVADIAMGKAPLPGIGVDAFRGSLPEEFLETWGYGIRVDYFEYYESLGAADELVFVGYPGPAHRMVYVFATNISPRWGGHHYNPLWSATFHSQAINLT